MSDSEQMFQFGFEAGYNDREAGTFSKPIPTEDGEDYTRGYLEGWVAS